ncbi:MAG: cell division protein FtsB [Xanthomonadales bacterium]|nr:cell division protein FtsB [Xanthomonadales bacterium]NIN58249.1 cell division protein FtsB [Xanthomonadales bacterium]NIN73601.1 cell division protein FtsB [Xanthomonadales bacterium]NIO13716.1 cell division protein FtsB [Xanthomonadales bacterium]NIP10642.1 cell division protein FtsB [Xanthomonadales bacterium]
MRWLIAALLLVLVFLQFRLWFGEGGVTEVARLEERVQQQSTENESLRERNAELRAEVEDLRERLDAVEERARSELGLIRDDEEFYQVVPPPPNPGDPP